MHDDQEQEGNISVIPKVTLLRDRNWENFKAKNREMNTCFIFRNSL